MCANFSELAHHLAVMHAHIVHISRLTAEMAICVESRAGKRLAFEVMQRFRLNQIQILVATTVVEVGVDVPNATVMVIEHAERFGLAQLHQLRGRIGRGSQKSHCILVAPYRMSDDGRARLETMVRTNNGFEIAETDLLIRGPGEFFGTRQSGELGFNIANPLRDRELLELARREAFHLTDELSQKEALQKVLRLLPPQWQRRYQLAKVG